MLSEQVLRHVHSQISPADGAIARRWTRVGVWPHRTAHQPDPAAGIPLYQPPLGPLGNILLSLLTGALLGVISAWPENNIHGTFIASAFSAVVILVGNFALAAPSGNTLVAILVTGIFLVLPSGPCWCR